MSRYFLSSQNCDELMHYGILGMKWGIRRSPEELGHSRVQNKYPRKRSDISRMSDSELQSKINRIQKERQYLDLTQNPIVAAGKTAVKSILVASAVELMKELVKSNLRWKESVEHNFDA